MSFYLSASKIISSCPCSLRGRYVWHVESTYWSRPRFHIKFCTQSRPKPQSSVKQPDQRKRQFEDLTRTIDRLCNVKRLQTTQVKVLLRKNSANTSRAEAKAIVEKENSPNNPEWITSVKSFTDQLIRHQSAESSKSFNQNILNANRTDSHVTTVRPEHNVAENAAVLNNSENQPTSSSVIEVENCKEFVKKHSNKSKKTKLKSSRPHVEHQERGTSHFFKTTGVEQSIDHLSTYELLVLSQAKSLPLHMRQMFQEFLDNRPLVASSSSFLAFPPSVVSVDVELLDAVNKPLNTPVHSSSDMSSFHSPVIESVTDLVGLASIPEPLQSPLIDKKFEPREIISEVVEKEQLQELVNSAKGSRERRSMLWSVEDFENTERMKVVVDRVKGLLKESKKSAVLRAIETDQHNRDVMYIEDISAFIELCIHTGMLKYAQSVLTMGYLRGKQRNKRQGRGIRPVRDLPTYNKLIHAWAKQTNMGAIRMLLSQLADLEIKPDLASYAFALECLGRREPFSREETKAILTELTAAGYDLKDIFNASHLIEEDKKFVLKAIHNIYPHFTPNQRVHSTGYTQGLLEHLNEKKIVENPFNGVMTAEQLSVAAARQLDIEMKDKVTFQTILPRPQLTPEIVKAKERLSVEREKWKEGLKRGFLTSRQHLSTFSDAEMGPSLVPYLRLWNADTYVDMMLQEVEVLGQDMAAYSPTCSVLHQILGQRLYNKFVVQSRCQSKYTDKVLTLYKQYAKDFDATHLRRNHREMWTELMHDMHLENDIFNFRAIMVWIEGIKIPLFCLQQFNGVERWPYSTTKALGKFLYDIIMSEVKVKVNVRKTVTSDDTARSAEDTEKHATEKSVVQSEIPAFFTVYRMRNGMPMEEVLPHPFLVRLYEDANISQLSFSAQEMPSLVPPMPWLSHTVGGSLLSTMDFIRNQWQAKKQLQLLKSRSPSSIYPMLDGLNSISACPWIINKPMLDILIEVFNSGGNEMLSIPENVKLASALPKITSDMTLEERLKVQRENKTLLKDRKEGYSQWCTELYRLSIANKYRDEIIWFPHNVDFRGRIYPTPPHFNHMGSDVGRSLLKFGKGKALGPRGLDWLKTHLVNLTGLKKRQSNAERLQFANEMMDNILDSADKPFTGNGWWKSSDEPWQTLSCCKEIAAAVRSLNPEEFICHLPVHQDGSFNGMQHYAALGRNVSGAQSVNLQPFDLPQDVYSNVVELVEQRRVKDAENGLEIAKSLEGFVRRKIIKQSIMTTVYGVTNYGARRQIRGQLEHLPDFPESLVWPAMHYLTEKTFESLQEMFCSMKEIQDWFVLCADIISRIRQKPVEWDTPLGWPVIQPYTKSNRITDKVIGSAMLEKPNAQKQKNGFPPNFIHSLDSAHMILTAIHCLRAGVLFVSIHDCFWTHACSVDDMNKICREQFVALHNQQILENLALSMTDKFGFKSESAASDKNIERTQAKEFVNYVLQKVPKRGQKMSEEHFIVRCKNNLQATEYLAKTVYTPQLLATPMRVTLGPRARSYIARNIRYQQSAGV